MSGFQFGFPSSFPFGFQSDLQFDFQFGFQFDFQFENLTDFLAMSGHGVFVWSAYGITTFVLIGLAIRPMLRKRKFLAVLSKQVPGKQLPSGQGQRSSEGKPR